MYAVGEEDAGSADEMLVVVEKVVIDVAAGVVVATAVAVAESVLKRVMGKTVEEVESETRTGGAMSYTEERSWISWFSELPKSPRSWDSSSGRLSEEAEGDDRASCVQ